MSSVILPEGEFHLYLLTCAFAPLVLLVPLLFVRDRTWRATVASFTFLLPALLVVGFWTVTDGRTDPELGDIGFGLMVISAMWVVLMCLASLWCGALCVRAHRWTLLWLVPEAATILFLAFFLLRAFT